MPSRGQNRYFIAIEGAIGVGKTTLARLLKDEFQAELLLEVFEENPFLPLFYQDRTRYAFQTQVFFLLSRYRQQSDGVPEALSHSTLMSDYTFTKDRLFASLNLQGDELEMYERIHAILATKIPAPDLVVWLQADTDVLMQRIALRDRIYERNMDRDYIDAVNRAYEHFFSFYQDSAVLPIDTNRLDYVSNSEDLQIVIQRIRGALELRPYQPPLAGVG